MFPFGTMTLLLSKTNVVTWFKRNKQRSLQYYIHFDAQFGHLKKFESLEKITASVLRQKQRQLLHKYTRSEV
jgi:hypothetical protein